MENIALHRVPAENRLHWINIAAIQGGVLICVPTLMLGAVLADGMPLLSAILSGAIGYLIAVILFVLQGIQGNDLGLPTVMVASSSFGREGARKIVSVLFMLSLIGWFAVQTNICGTAFTLLLSRCFHIQMNDFLPSFIFGIIMLTTAVYGIKGLKMLNLISIPALIIICIYGVVDLLRVNGIGPLIHSAPQNHISFIEGVSLTLSFLSIGAVITPDVTRYQKNRGDTVKSNVVGILPIGIIMIVMGAVFSIVAKTYDITIILSNLGIPVLSMLVLILSTWTANTANIYSAGLDTVMLFNLKDSKRAFATVVTGLIGTFIGALGFMNYFVDFLNLLGVVFIPVAGVMIANYWIIHKGKPELWKEKERFCLVGILSWLSGVVASLVFYHSAPLFFGFFTSFILYITLTVLYNKQKNQV